MNHPLSIHQIANHEMPIQEADSGAHLFNHIISSSSAASDTVSPPAPPLAQTKFGPIKGGRLDEKNGSCCVWLSVPYAGKTPRWSDPCPLPSDYKYKPTDKEWIYDEHYCFQTSLDGQAPGVDVRDKCGWGEQSEDVLFVNIVAPSDCFDYKTGRYDNDNKYPVKVYFHGGYLQWGGAAGLKSQAQFAAQARSEVRVNVGYRINIFGFLAAQEPYLSGNYGFKDQWLALEWIKDNISAFGGNPRDIHISGLSAGAHSVHQLLHYASRLDDNKEVPFTSAHLMSNAILIDSKTPEQGQFQFDALAKYFGYSIKDQTEKENALENLRNLPGREIITAIEELYKSQDVSPVFRSTTDGEWMKNNAMQWQRSGELAKKLKQKGIKYVLLGDTKDEWFLYALLHVVKTPKMVREALGWAYPTFVVKKLFAYYGSLNADASYDDCQKYLGQVFADCQVHLPVRILATDLRKGGIPTVRYESRYASPIIREKMQGNVTHGSDMPMWFVRGLNDDENQTSLKFLDAVDKAVSEAQSGSAKKEEQVLTLTEEGNVEWRKDLRYAQMIKLENVLGI